MSVQADVAIVGGGIAGSALAIVLASGGLGVVVIEREPVFRDRVRGEGIHPWGVHEARLVGLLPMLHEAGARDLPFWQPYRDRIAQEPFVWAEQSIGGLPEIGISHPSLQNTAIRWATSAGARVLRPARAARFRAGKTAEIDVATLDGEVTVRARLVVGADGRRSAVRRWAGAETIVDDAHHRFGGVLLQGHGFAPDATHEASFDGGRVFVMPQAEGKARAYLVLDPGLAKPLERGSAAGAMAEMASKFPESALAEATVAGPLAFFSNADIWSTSVASDRVVLVGDAAGANDPSAGQGLSLVFRDVRELSERLLNSADWPSAIADYAANRRAYYAVVREHAKWMAQLTTETGPAAFARRERVERAREIDPSAAGFALIFARGPDGLVADEAARRQFFGETG